MHASNGILFNHESPIRGETFVTQKIILGIANIEIGKQDCIYLGNLDSQRDWGHAKDFVEGMWKIVQNDIADDFVLATGRTVSVRKFIELAFKELDKEIYWEGSGVNEVGKDSSTDKVLIRIDPNYFRPTEVDILVGDSTKAREVLGWKAQISLEKLIKEMMTIAMHNAKQPKQDLKLADF